jgi:hypothetical protein
MTTDDTNKLHAISDFYDKNGYTILTFKRYGKMEKKELLQVIKGYRLNNNNLRKIIEEKTVKISFLERTVEMLKQRFDILEHTKNKRTFSYINSPKRNRPSKAK